MTYYHSDSGGREGCAYAYTYATRQRRRKVDWAGVGIGDAFKAQLDYYQRLPAQRIFYRMVKKAQRRVARTVVPSQAQGRFEALAKPQIGPCYTTYPSNLAAHAAIGLTAYLEYKARVKRPLLAAHMQNYLADPAAADRVAAMPESYKHVARSVVEVVDQRLLLEDLQRACGLPALEIYRLFSCCQQGLQFLSIGEILQAVVLYGDVLPAWEQTELHTTTREILSALFAVSRSFFPMLASVGAQTMLNVGEQWAHRLCLAMAPFLLPARPALPGSEAEYSAQRSGAHRAGEPFDAAVHPDGPDPELAPLEAPRAPGLEKPSSAGLHALRSMQQAVDESARGAAPGSEFPEAGEKGPLDESTAKILEELSQTMNRAGGQARNWEDMRSDLVEETLGRGSFREGPITGNPAEGNEVRVSLGGREMAAGEVYDRPVEVSDDLAAYERLRGEAQPIAEILRRNLYPNRELVPESLRLRAGGVLDGNRLALAGFSSTVFKRFRNVEKADRRGRPVLVIACDGSGSLNHLQMRMLKVLTAAWLNSTVGSEIQVLAALYHSGSIRPGVGGPLVQWIYHPQKTPAIGRAEAARTLVSLPSTGTGVQSDALSLAFIMNEARRLAKRSSIYLTLLSDTAWNKSFQTPLTGREEVMQLFQDLKTERDDKLHTVLVALGAGTPTGFETLLDKVIVVSPQELADYTSVAEHIGLYVANCLRQRRGARTL